MEPIKTAQLLTVNEVVEALRVSRSRVYELFDSGELVSVKLGQRRMVRQSDLEAFVENLSDAGDAA